MPTQASSRTISELLDASKKLITIPSTADNIEALHQAVDFITKRVVSSGKDITIEQFNHGGKPSFLAYRRGQRPENFRIILNGHVDVVPGKPEQFKPFVKDGKLYGRGSFDMKTACLVLADAFVEFVDQVPYALGLQIVSDEESTGVRGTRHQIEQGVRADFVICGECGRSTKVHEIANEAKGRVVAEIRFKGTHAHAAYLWKGQNAAIKAALFAVELDKRYPAKETPDTTIALTKLVADDNNFALIPNSATIIVDARYAPGDPNFRSKAHFAALIEEIDPNAEIVHFHEFGAPVYTDPENPLLLQLKAAAEHIEKAPFKFARRHATSDGRWFGAVGDQACEFGIAGEDQHGSNEYVPVQAIEHYQETLRHFLATTVITEAANTPTKAYDREELTATPVLG